jgi:poly(beta-D-mannuronate) lyase
MTGNVVKGKLYEIEPDYVNAAEYDFAQRAGSRPAQLGIGVKKVMER